MTHPFFNLKAVHLQFFNLFGQCLQLWHDILNVLLRLPQSSRHTGVQ